MSAVVGAGLGGLAVAALLSGKKKKIIVIERGGSLSGAVGAYDRDGFSFTASPALSYGFERGGAFYTLSANLGIVQSVSVQSPCYQVALPDHRITVFADQGETLEELRREYPKEINVLIKFYRDLHSLAEKSVKSRFWSYVTTRRSAAGFIRGYRFSRELTRSLISSPSISFKDRLQNYPWWTLSRCAIPRRSTSKVVSKNSPISCIAPFFSREVKFCITRRTAELASRGGHIVGIKAKQGVIEADTILLNLSKRYDSSTIFMGLRDTVIPVGMCPEVLYLPDYQSPRDFYTLSLSAKR